MKNILILDTETTLGFGSPLIYDFGYQIVSPLGIVLVKRSALVLEVFDTKDLMDKAYYSDKYESYCKLFENGLIEKLSFRKIMKRFVSDCRKHKVEIIGAYNLAFDMRAINKSLFILDNASYESKYLEKFFAQKNKKLLCIWNLSCETILNTDEYRKFADENKLVSKSGNYQTSAEVAYQYIKNMPEFVEKHMAIEDVEIETEILLHILQNYNGIITYGLHYGSWRKAQKKKE